MSSWECFPFSKEAIKTISMLNYRHMIILWIDLENSFPGMTEGEIDDYFVNAKEDIARRLSYESWDEIVAEKWEDKPAGAIHELHRHLKWAERMKRE